MARALNQIEASFYRRMERVGGFGGKADQLNGYYYSTGHARLLRGGSRALPRTPPTDIQAAVQSTCRRIAASS